jgi:hypothetical protein
MQLVCFVESISALATLQNVHSEVRTGDRGFTRGDLYVRVVAI